MRKFKIKRSVKKYTAAAAFTAMAAFLPFTVTGCKAQVSVDATVVKENVSGTEAEKDLKESTLTAVGSADTMVESGECLYFKYGDSVWRLNKATDKLEKIKTFAEGESNGSFWIYRGNLYYDVNSAKGEEAARLYALYKLNLETGEDEHQADLMNQASGIYASEGILYVNGYNMNQAYALKEDGSLDKELTAEQTVYGQIPAGCRELYRGILPYMAEHYEYMPIQNDSCLVIANEDGSGAREVPEVTNTSSVLFDKDGFFALFQDGSGNTQCYRYDPKTLEKTMLFESPDNPQLIQYRDGFLYYLTSKAYQTVSEGTQYYKVDTSTGETKKAASVKTEPGTTNMYDYYGNFFVTEDGIYCQEIKDYGVYIGRTELGEEEERLLLEPALYQSAIRELGHVEAEKAEILCSCGEIAAAELYIEKMVFEGSGKAAEAMNRVMDERGKELLEYGKEMASYMDESWIHSDDFHIATLTYEIVDINYMDERYVCIEADGYEYSGGAHGMPSREYFVFDRETGKQLKLRDMVDNSAEELQGIVGRAFRELAEKTNFAFEAPEDLEHTIADDVSFDSEFYVTSEGIVFYYEPYEIAPYAEGFPEVTVPFEELKMRMDF